jgi:hypothetical protein
LRKIQFEIKEINPIFVFVFVVFFFDLIQKSDFEKKIKSNQKWNKIKTKYPTLESLLFLGH